MMQVFQIVVLAKANLQVQVPVGSSPAASPSSLASATSLASSACGSSSFSCPGNRARPSGHWHGDILHGFRDADRASLVEAFVAFAAFKSPASPAHSL